MGRTVRVSGCIRALKREVENREMSQREQEREKEREQEIDREREREESCELIKTEKDIELPDLLYNTHSGWR